MDQTKQVKGEIVQRLYRSRSDSVLGGICGGLGDYWGIDPVFLRVILIFITVVTAVVPVALCYLIAWMIIPLAPVDYQGKVYARLFRSKHDRRIAGVCGGIAQFFNVDSTMIRLIVVFLGLVTAVVPMMMAYLVAWIVIPNER